MREAPGPGQGTRWPVRERADTLQITVAAALPLELVLGSSHKAAQGQHGAGCQERFSFQRCWQQP